jgi:F0F1-type ATP synthase delta subunit
MQATEVDFGMGSTDDNPFDDTELLKLLDHLNMLGEDVYGAQWEQVREHNVKRVSGGKVTSSDKLTPEQLQKLIAGIEKIRRRRTQPIAVAA